jgi:hypothetical protein
LARELALLLGRQLGLQKVSSLAALMGLLLGVMWVHESALVLEDLFLSGRLEQMSGLLMAYLWVLMLESLMDAPSAMVWDGRLGSCLGVLLVSTWACQWEVLMV